MKTPVRKVARIDQSPMNETRWCLTLECKHEVWMTAKNRPARENMRCEQCGRTTGGK